MANQIGLRITRVFGDKFKQMTTITALGIFSPFYLDGNILVRNIHYIITKENLKFRQSPKVYLTKKQREEQDITSLIERIVALEKKKAKISFYGALRNKKTTINSSQCQ